MTQALSKSLHCICMSNGVEIWLEEDRIKNILVLLHPKDEDVPPPAFLNITGSLNEIRTAHIVGIFDAATMEASTRRKNGEWMCKGLQWHQRGEKFGSCDHPDPSLIQSQQARERAYKACGKCDRGWRSIKHEGRVDTVAPCECQGGL